LSEEWTQDDEREFLEWIVDSGKNWDDYGLPTNVRSRGGVLVELLYVPRLSKKTKSPNETSPNDKLIIAKGHNIPIEIVDPNDPNAPPLPTILPPAIEQ